MRIRNALTPASRSTANGLATGADGDARKGRAASAKSWPMSTPCQVSSLWAPCQVSSLWAVAKAKARRAIILAM